MYKVSHLGIILQTKYKYYYQNLFDGFGPHENHNCTYLLTSQSIMLLWFPFIRKAGHMAPKPQEITKRITQYSKGSANKSYF